jgi:hypothetical protein
VYSGRIPSTIGCTIMTQFQGEDKRSSLRRLSHVQGTIHATPTQYHCPAIMHTHMQTHIRTYVQKHIRSYVHIVCTYLPEGMCMYAHTHAGTLTCVRTYVVQKHILTYIRTVCTCLKACARMHTHALCICNTNNGSYGFVRVHILQL